MQVKELIEYLQDFDQEAEVRIMSQPSWPFEYSVSGIAAREDFEDIDEGEQPQRREKNQSDVFLIEGSQICYGNKDAWSSCR
jgi:hypothetical protein